MSDLPMIVAYVVLAIACLVSAAYMLYVGPGGMGGRK